MRTYKQLSQAQRYQIEILKKAGKNQKEIAELLDVSPATISRELNRNKGKKGFLSETGAKQGGQAPETGRQAHKDDGGADSSD